MTRPGSPRRRLGFTMIELLVVILIIALLVALLLPAINAAVKTAKSAAVQAEINQMAQALADFKSKMGDYPPSRFCVNESGAVYPSNTAVASPTATADVTYGQLYQRTLTAFRKFWPRVVFNNGGPISGFSQTTTWYDFNGDTKYAGDNTIVVQGHEALVFFLGGIANNPGGTGVLGVTGFAKSPTNPFTNSANRNPPYFQFDAGRLVTNPATGMAGYLDSLSSSTVVPPQNFYAYFSVNNGAGYDPNDVNFEGPASKVTYVGQVYTAEQDGNQLSPIGVNFTVGVPVYAPGTTSPALTVTQSPSPNPYTSSPPAGASVTSVSFVNPQSFQIISGGIDGQFGIGGAYTPSSNAGALPAENGISNSKDPGVRIMERDNLTNFHNGKLE